MRLHDIQVSINALNAVDKMQAAQQAQLQAAAAQQMLHMKKNVEAKEHLVTPAVEESPAAAVNERTPGKKAEKGETAKRVKSKKNIKDNSTGEKSDSGNHIIDIKA